MKIDFEFKQGDYVELEGMSDEQVEAVKEEMLKQAEGEWWSNVKRDPIDKALIMDSKGDVFYTGADFAEDRLLTVKDIFPTLEHGNDTDMENTANSLEESLREFNLQDVKSWKCFEEVAEVLGVEDAEWELSKVLRQINDGKLEYNDAYECLSCSDLCGSFDWGETVQGWQFWNSIVMGEKPEDYDITPDTPSAKKATPALKELMSLTKDSDLEGMLNNVSEDNKHEDLTESKETIGSLIEKLYMNLPPSGVQIVISEAGIYLTGAEMPTINISKMDPKVIDKTFETFVECEGLWVDFQEKSEQDCEE